jgi:hypothetical protein
MPKYTDEQLDREVLFLLKQHLGQKNPIGRWEIVARLFGPEACAPRNDDNLADRQVRESVARLRKAGVLVCDMGDGAGRFLAQSLEEYQAFRLKYGSRAYEVLETLREMDKAAGQLWPNVLQPALFDAPATRQQP